MADIISINTKSKITNFDNFELENFIDFNAGKISWMYLIKVTSIGFSLDELLGALPGLVGENGLDNPEVDVVIPYAASLISGCISSFVFVGLRGQNVGNNKASLLCLDVIRDGEGFCIESYGGTTSGAAVAEYFQETVSNERYSLLPSICNIGGEVCH